MSRRIRYPEAFQQHVRELLAHCLAAIQHSEYRVSLEWSSSAKPDDDDHASTHATVQGDTTYLFFTVTIYPEMLASFKAKKFKDVGDTLLHECCHLLTEPLALPLLKNCSPAEHKFYLEIVERQTQRFTNALMAQMGGEWYLPKDLRGHKGDEV